MIKYLISKVCHSIVRGSDYYRNSLKHNLAEISTSTKLSQGTVFQNPSNSRKNIRIGDRCTIMDAELVLFGHGGSIEIGHDCFVGSGTRIWSGRKITIGNNVLISHNVNIHDNNSHPINSTERRSDYEFFFRTGRLRDQNTYDLKDAEVTICDNAWLGFNSTIAKGVRIGTGAIVGAYSFVTKSVPDYAVVVGNPARIIKFTD